MMTIEEKIETIRNYCVGASGKIISFRLQSTELEKNKNIVEIVNSAITNDSFKFGEKVRLLIYNGGDTCGICKTTKLVKIGSSSNPYACRACALIAGAEKRKTTTKERFGVEFASQSESIKKKVKTTNRERFGVDHPAQSSEILQKMKETTKERYGVENAMQSEEIRDKARATNIERFGVESASKNSEIREKIVKTNLERFGVSNPMKNVEIVEKVISTNIERYGVSNPMQSSEIRAKVVATNIERYGSETPMENDVVKNRALETMQNRYGCHVSKLPDHRQKVIDSSLERFGYENASYSPVVKDQITKTHIEKFGVRRASMLPEIHGKAVETSQRLYGTDYPNQSYLVCSDNWENQHPEIMNNLFVHHERYIDSGVSLAAYASSLGVSCTVLGRKFKQLGLEIPFRKGIFGAAQEEFRKLIYSSYGIEGIADDRKALNGKEIDIYYPDRQVGIEYHGLYWHSEKYKQHTDHQVKAQIAKSVGVKLLQFFSSEVEQKPEIVLSIIGNSLGTNPVKIHGRKCQIIELDSKTSYEFCEDNHLQGANAASIRYGLVHEGSLVSVMTFAKSRFDDKVEYEMIRFCNLLGHTVIGGASRLWKHFIKNVNPSSVVTYADARISNGAVYEKLDFKYSHTSKPNYFYTKDFSTLESRIKYQKHKLKSMPIYNDSWSEKEIMNANGYSRIYDAGNLVFKWFRKE